MSEPDALLRFVREALALGRDRAEIAATLRDAGWPEEQVHTALRSFADVDYPVPVPRPKPYLSAKEAFWYLVLFTTLYLWAIFFGVLLFDLIDVAVPDATDPDYTLRYRADGIRWAIAAILVAFPTFLFMARFIGRSLEREPEKRASRVRKWLTYLTLFVTVCILVGDLMSLLYNLLSGDLTLRFLLKVVVVGVIAGGILVFYLLDLRRDDAPLEQQRSVWSRRIGMGLSGVIAAGIVAGFFVIGSPTTARGVQLDDQRIDDLRFVESSLATYWARERTLPADLTEVTAIEYRSDDVLLDPETGVAYDYEVRSDSTYTLCATFDAPRPEQRYTPPSTEIVPEGTGRQCFNLNASN
ncbi:MAG: DUF5671 domain-containing protein [Bacteroidota bacterium]